MQSLQVSGRSMRHVKKKKKPLYFPGKTQTTHLTTIASTTGTDVCLSFIRNMLINMSKGNNSLAAVHVNTSFGTTS